MCVAAQISHMKEKTNFIYIIEKIEYRNRKIKEYETFLSK